MSIWHTPIDIATLNQRGDETMCDFLDIRFTDVGDDYLTATMPFSERTRQPIGIMHGGANVVLAETIASTAANAVINIETHYCVGLEINANHIRSVREGVVTAITRPQHLGRSTQVWLIEIFDEKNRLTCSSRMTASVIERR